MGIIKWNKGALQKSVKININFEKSVKATVKAVLPWECE